MRAVITLALLSLLVLSGCGSEEQSTDQNVQQQEEALSPVQEVASEKTILTAEEEFGVSVEFHEGSYSVENSSMKFAGGHVPPEIYVDGYFDLTLCNNDEDDVVVTKPGSVFLAPQCDAQGKCKTLPIGVRTTFQEQDAKELSSTLLKSLSDAIEMRTEAGVSIAPDSCKDMTFTFRHEFRTSESAEHLPSKAAYTRADYKAYYSEQEWTLTKEEPLTEQQSKDFMQKLDQEGLRLGEQYCYELTTLPLMEKCADLTFQLAVRRSAPSTEEAYCELVKAKELCVAALGMTEEKLIAALSELG